jgi:primosomal protein N' (replication factor Y)
VLADLFPEHVVARMDSDSMRGRGRHGKTLDAFRRGEVHILLGTQMIAKGLDFPNVTVVGVLNADMSLNLPDFRAAERTFQLLAQVAGRAGRGDKGGRVFIQTFTPEHDCVAAAAAHDFDGFAETELRQRREFAYPPYTRLARVLCEATKPEQAQECASAAADRMRAAAVGKGVVVLGPAPTAIPRLRGKHRWHVCLKAPDSRQLHDVLAALDGLEARRVQVTVDVDPVSLL